MGRKKVVAKREIIPDPKFHDVVVTKFVNALMKGGKKSVVLTSARSGVSPVSRLSAPITSTFFARPAAMAAIGSAEVIPFASAVGRQGVADESVAQGYSLLK